MARETRLYRLSRFGLVTDGALKYFSERFSFLRREFPDAPDAIDRLIQKDSFEIRSTSDQDAWRQAMTLTSPRGDKHTPPPPGANAKVTVRIELDESAGTYALDLMKLEYVSPEGHRREVKCGPD